MQGFALHVMPCDKAIPGSFAFSICLLVHGYIKNLELID